MKRTPPLLLLRAACLPLLLALAPAAPNASAANPPAFDAANDLFAAGNFTAARDGYLNLVAAGNHSANLFYNLANTYRRLDEPGRAILNLERALLIDPFHPEATGDLALLRSRFGAALPQLPIPLRWYPTLPHDAWAILLAAGAWIALAALAAAPFSPKRRPQLAAAAAAGLALALAALPPTLADPRTTAVAIVTARHTAARLAPAETAAVAAQLPAGSHVTILAERGGWTYCKLPDGTRAWLPPNAVESLLPSRPS